MKVFAVGTAGMKDWEFWASRFSIAKFNLVQQKKFIFSPFGRGNYPKCTPPPQIVDLSLSRTITIGI